MKMDRYMREDLIKKVEAQRRRCVEFLKELKIPRSTYYKWRKTYRDEGLQGFLKTKSFTPMVEVQTQKTSQLTFLRVQEEKNSLLKKPFHKSS